jgi:hypothetical protein
MLVDPFRCLAIQGTLDVITLEGKHFTDSHDHVAERFCGGPMISNANRMWRDVGMKDRREQSAHRCIAWVSTRQSDFQPMSVYEY